MAKDGTNRGGSRAGAGRKSKALADKLTAGNPGGRKLTVVNFDNDTAELEGSDMPPVKEYLKASQKGGIDLCAEDVYKETWQWLKERGCEKLISTQLLEQYAMCVARWIQCEEAISTYGLLGKHPTTGGVIASPFVQMSQQFQKNANLIWYEIYGIVKENCTEPVGDDLNDSMERLLRSRKG